MQGSNFQKSDFFTYLGKTICVYDDESPEEFPGNSYFLDAINEIDAVFITYKGSFGVTSFKDMSQVLKYHDNILELRKCHGEEGKGEVKMVRVSECKYLVALVYEGSISIEKSLKYYSNGWINVWEKEEEEIWTGAKFTLSEGRYVYLEWSPLNDAYIESPSFLTFDDKGRLRLHFVKGKKQQIFFKVEFQKVKREEFIGEGEVFRSATFSWDGEYIYAINDQQEICKIDIQDLKVVLKKKIEGLSNPEEVISPHVMQINPWTLVIGSVIKSSNDEGEYLKPYLHLISGDLSDQEEKLKVKAFEMPFFDTLESQKSVVFRTLYVKERQLLLFGHTGSNKVRMLRFGFDGSIIENDGITLEKTTLQGMLFLKEENPGEPINQNRNKKSTKPKKQYQNKKLELLKNPQFMILDSLGGIHHFHYNDANSYAPTLSIFIRLISDDELGCFARQMQLKARRKKARKNRCKSVCPKIENTSKRKKRSKSQIPIKFLTPKKTITMLEEKQKTIRLLKENHAPPASSSLGLFKQPASGNPFLPLKTTEDKPTSGLFSAIPSTGSSLFSFSNKPSFPSGSKPQNSLFGPTPATSKKSDLFMKQLEPDKSGLFSAKLQSRAFDTVPDDPTKKKAMLLLNKLESDVAFRVEDKEFPAHKSILSEKSTFFKNMFQSGMSESHSPVIEIFDTKALMFKAFLQYVYLGQSMLTEELAMGLFEFSEKYLIDELKANCEKYLANIITLKNCIKIYETACLYEVESLKKKTLRFFEANIKEIVKRKDFESLSKETYIDLKRIQWNDGVVFDPTFAELMKD